MIDSCQGLKYLPESSLALPKISVQYCDLGYRNSVLLGIFGTKYLRIDQVKFVEDSL